MVKARSRSRKISHSRYSEKCPQFFKIYVPTHCSQRLRIPPAFIKYLKEVLPSKSILRNTTTAKRSWHIDINKVDSNFFFVKGWPKFVRDNSLVFGDFLIFCYTGNSEFYVTIFGENNCPKEVPITSTRDCDDEPQPLLQGNQSTVGPCTSKERMCVDSTEMGARMSVRDNNGAVETPSELGSKKAFFESVMKPTYVYAGYMYIPSGFVESYMSTNGQTARLTRSDKSWVVMLKRRRRGVIFSCGWKKFVADNSVREGDVCNFELIQRVDDYAFNVAILRGNGTPNKAQGTKTTEPSSCRDEGS